LALGGVNRDREAAMDVNANMQAFIRNIAKSAQSLQLYMLHPAN